MQFLISCLLYNYASVITRAQLDAAKRLAKVCYSGISASGKMVCESGSSKTRRKNNIVWMEKENQFHFACLNNRGILEITG